MAKFLDIIDKFQAKTALYSTFKKMQWSIFAAFRFAAGFSKKITSDSFISALNYISTTYVSKVE